MFVFFHGPYIALYKLSSCLNYLIFFFEWANKCIGRIEISKNSLNRRPQRYDFFLIILFLKITRVLKIILNFLFHVPFGTWNVLIRLDSKASHKTTILLNTVVVLVTFFEISHCRYESSVPPIISTSHHFSRIVN